VGIRPGEKLHEVMVPEDEARMTLEFKDHFVILSEASSWTGDQPYEKSDGKRCADGFSYSSGTNTEWLTVDQIRSLVKDVEQSPVD
jgi:FlaA1/EpsC-like NDP-sugar epimerase